MPIATLSDLKAHFGITTATDDTRWQSCLDGANALAARIIKYDPSSTTYTEYLDGSGTNELVLPHPDHVTAVTQVKLDTTGGRGQVPDSFGTATVLTQGVDYITDLDRGVLEKWYNGTAGGGFGWLWSQQVGPTNYWRGLSTHGATQPYWPKVRGCIYVAYTAGFVAVPKDLKDAAIQVAAWLYNYQESGGLVPGSVNYIDTSASLTAADEQFAGSRVAAMTSARATFMSYREPTLASGFR